MLRVHFVVEDREPAPRILAELMGADAVITAGPDLPDLPDYEILVTGFPKRRHLEASPNLRALIVPFAGAPAATVELLREFPAVSMHNVHYNVIPTAEMAVALLLAASKVVIPADRNLRRGDWTLRFEPPPFMTLHGQSALILGYGQIGRYIAPICRALGMNVTGIRRTPSAADAGDVTPVHGPDALHHLLPEANVLLNVLPHTSETHELLGESEFALLPPDAIFVNIGRADTVDEEALYTALAGRRLLGAGLDVWYDYPKSKAERTQTYPSKFPFHELDNVVMSPHRAGFRAVDEGTRMDHVARLLRVACAGGAMPNRIDKELGY